MPAKVSSCPVCGTDMKKRIVGDGVELDYCDAPHLVGCRGAGVPARDEGGGKGEGESVGQQVAKRLGRAAVPGAGFHVGGRPASGSNPAILAYRELLYIAEGGDVLDGSK